jgi:ankyrin repeat protein
VTAQDERGSTPLHQVSRKGHLDLAEFLIEHGADLTAQDKDGLTPQDRALRNGRADLAHFLAEQCPNVMAPAPPQV